MSDTKVVFLNGPPGSGKDLAASYVSKMTVKTWNISFKTLPVEMVKLAYCIDDNEWSELYTRENKEIPTDRLNGLSPRQAIIHMSEEVIKPNFGKDYIGKWIMKLMEEKEKIGFKRFIFSDSGFIEEAQPIIDKYGSSNCAVFKLIRPGHDFEGDSRRYLYPSDFDDRVKFINFYNDGTIEDFCYTIMKQFKEFCGYCD